MSYLLRKGNRPEQRNGHTVQKTPVAGVCRPTTQRGPFGRPVIIREGFAEIIFCISFPVFGM